MSMGLHRGRYPDYRTEGGFMSNGSPVRPHWRLTRCDRADHVSATVRERTRDGGFSIVEILISVVLLGLGTAGTLSAMVASIDASVGHRDLTNEQTWLQGAADYLQGQPREDCDDVNGVPGEAQSRIASKYQTYVQTVVNPDGWPAADITVLSPVKFWDGDQYQSNCYDNNGINLQLVTLQVRSPNGKTTRTLQVVRGA
jgi:type II secretory pathway pseudopilin PulG